MIGIFLSIILPGLGQLYYGKNVKGLIMIILTFVPFLYPIILIWSLIDCINLRKKHSVDPITRKEAITAIIIFFIIIPIFTGLLIFGGIQAYKFYSDNYSNPRQTKQEMNEIYLAITKIQSETNKIPGSLTEIIGNHPLRQTWFIDSWKNPYFFKLHEETNEYVLVSAGKDQKYTTDDDIVLKFDSLINKNN